MNVSRSAETDSIEVGVCLSVLAVSRNPHDLFPYFPFLPEVTDEFPEVAADVTYCIFEFWFKVGCNQPNVCGCVFFKLRMMMIIAID